MFKISDFEHINKNFEWTHAINSRAENATNWKKYMQINRERVKKLTPTEYVNDKVQWIMLVEHKI